jgi:hypothetical protein
MLSGCTGQPRRPGIPRRAVGLTLLLLLGAGTSTAAAELASITQTVRWLRPGDEVGKGAYWVSYTSLALRSDRWSLRGSLSWLSWDPDSPDALADRQSGFGALYLTAGRRLWSAAETRRSLLSSGWVRLRTKLPLEGTSSPLGSGAADWGVSLFTSTGWKRIFVLAEGGYLDLGDSNDVAYRPLASASVSVSYRPRDFVFYPLASVFLSSSSREGDPAYAEGSAGIGVPTSRNTSLSVLVSRGLSRISPVASAALLISWHP